MARNIVDRFAAPPPKGFVDLGIACVGWRDDMREIGFRTPRGVVWIPNAMAEEVEPDVWRMPEWLARLEGLP